MTIAQKSSPSVSRRLVFIDVLRLIAALQMIQGHAVAAMLAPSYRSGPGFQVWTFARGLTSVAFLFSAGFAFALAEARASDLGARRRRVGRALRLLVIGYAMHAPLGMLLGTPASAALRGWAVVDVLQCIGVSLLSVELLSWRVAGWRARVLGALSLASFLFAVAPAAHGLTLSDRALALGNYFTGRYGSLFPLLPWSGYLFVGFGLGQLAVRTPRHVVRVLLGGAAVALPVGLAISYALPVAPLSVNPGYALVKLGCVLVIAGGLAQGFRHVTRLPRTLAQLASQTLFLYVSHVVILSADHVGLAHLLGNQHGPLFGVALALVLLVVCSLLALGLGSLRARSVSGTRAAPSP